MGRNPASGPMSRSESGLAILVGFGALTVRDACRLRAARARRAAQRCPARPARRACSGPPSPAPASGPRGPECRGRRVGLGQRDRTDVGQRVYPCVGGGTRALDAIWQSA